MLVWLMPYLGTLRKVGIGILSLVLTFGLGMLYEHETRAPVIVTQVVEKKVEVQGATKIVYRDRVVTRAIQTTKKPDGTVVTKEVDRTEVKDKDTDKHTDKVVDSKAQTSTVVQAPAEEEGSTKVGVVVGAAVGGAIGFFTTGGIGTHAGATLGGAVGGAIGALVGDIL